MLGSFAVLLILNYPFLVCPILITFTRICSVSRSWQLLLSSQQNTSRRLRLDSPTWVDCTAIGGFQEGYVIDWKSWQYRKGLSNGRKVSTAIVAGEAG